MANITIYPFGISGDQPAGAWPQKIASMQETIDLLAPWAFRESSNPLNPVWRDVMISPRPNGVAHLRIGTSTTANQNKFFLSPLIDLGGDGDKTLTFSGGYVTGTNEYLPALLFFNSNYEFQTYYTQTALPRTVSVTSSSSIRYVRLVSKVEYLFDSYIKDGTTSFLFDGSSVNYSSGSDTFLESGLIPDAWKTNSRGDYIGYNFTNNDEASTAARSDYNYPFYRIIGINGTPSSFSISKVIEVPAGRSIEFSCGEVDSNLMIRQLNPATKAASYFAANANPRTVTIGGSYTHLQLYFRTANYANCYIKDATNDVILWQGAASTE